MVAVKKIDLDNYDSKHQQKYLVMVAREVYILHKFRQLENNCYTVRLLDCQVNKEALADPSKLTTLYLVTNLEEVDLGCIFSRGTALNMD